MIMSQSAVVNSFDSNFMCGFLLTVKDKVFAKFSIILHYNLLKIVSSVNIFTYMRIIKESIANVYVRAHTYTYICKQSHSVAYAVFELMVIYEDNGDPPISATLIMLLQL